MDFSPNPVRVMHIDINSCFATIEQQANPLLRGKPTVVAAYAKDYGCILAASREAKALGIKTGMRVREGKWIYPRLIVLPPDPPKYRVVNRQLLSILRTYTPYVSVESIDEMVIKLSRADQHPEDVAREIKQRIRSEIGEWITVSIGIAPNRYLAKVASDQQKPDGLVTIGRDTILDIFSSMQLTDFCGIKEGNATRLRGAGISTPLALFRATREQLKRAFRSIVGYQWWLRLHGYEDGVMYPHLETQQEVPQKTYGQSYVLGEARTPDDPRLWQVLTQLVMKMGRRLRRDHMSAYGMGISVMYADYTHWHKQENTSAPIYADSDFYDGMRRILAKAEKKEVNMLAVFCYGLRSDSAFQPSLFAEENRKRDISRAIDAIQDRFGDFVIHPARMAHMEQAVLDRISFGGVQGLPDVGFEESIVRESFSSIISTPEVEMKDFKDH